MERAKKARVGPRGFTFAGTKEENTGEVGG